jgi:hypothetical protein
MLLILTMPAHSVGNKWSHGVIAGIAESAMKNIPIACRAKEKPMSNDSFLLLKEVYEERDAACERALSQISYLEETLREAQLEIKQLKSCLTDFKSYF